MDWIERFVGLSPDGGDGSTEALYIGVVLIVATLVLSRGYFAKIWQRWWGARS
jgi:hypothetical protein